MSKLIDYIDDLGLRDKITAYLQSNRKADIMLSDAEVQYMERVDYCDDVLRSYSGSQKELVEMVRTKYDITAVHAKKLLQDAKYIHGSTSKPVRQYDRARFTEILWDIVLKKKGMEPEVAMKAIELIMKLNKLDDVSLDVEPEDESSRGTVIIKPVFKPELLGVTLPDNIDEVIAKLRGRVSIHQKSMEALE